MPIFKNLKINLDQYYIRPIPEWSYIKQYLMHYQMNFDQIRTKSEVMKVFTIWHENSVEIYVPPASHLYIKIQWKHQIFGQNPSELIYGLFHTFDIIYI